MHCKVYWVWLPVLYHWLNIEHFTHTVCKDIRRNHRSCVFVCVPACVCVCPLGLGDPWDVSSLFHANI